MAPRNFDGREFCPGAPMPATRPPATLGMCHTCNHFSDSKPTIQPDVFMHDSGPMRGTPDCRNFAPLGHEPTVRGISSAQVSHGLGPSCNHSEHTPAVMCGNEQEQSA